MSTPLYRSSDASSGLLYARARAGSRPLPASISPIAPPHRRNGWRPRANSQTRFSRKAQAPYSLSNPTGGGASSGSGGRPGVAATGSPAVGVFGRLVRGPGATAKPLSQRAKPVQNWTAAATQPPVGCLPQARRVDDEGRGSRSPRWRHAESTTREARHEPRGKSASASGRSDHGDERCARCPGGGAVGIARRGSPAARCAREVGGRAPGADSNHAGKPSSSGGGPTGSFRSRAPRPAVFRACARRQMAPAGSRSGR